MRNPNRLRQFTIACVSSLQRAPRRTTGSLARAARIKERLVRRFEPGRTTVASVRRLGGTISMRSGSMVRELCVAHAASATGSRAEMLHVNRFGPQYLTHGTIIASELGVSRALVE